MAQQEAPKKLATWKIVVGLIAAVLLLVVVAVVGIGVYFGLNSEKLKESGIRARAEGAAYGSTSTQRQCVEMAQSKVDTSGFMEEVMNRVFLAECLSHAQPTADLCTGVPAESSILETAAWRIRTCTEYGKEGSQSCARLLEAVQDHCHPTKSGNESAVDSAR